MANETRINLGVSFSKNGVDFSKSISSTGDKSDGEYTSGLIDSNLASQTISPGAAGTLILVNRGHESVPAESEVMVWENSDAAGQYLELIGQLCVLRCRAATAVKIASVNQDAVKVERIWIPD